MTWANLPSLEADFNNVLDDFSLPITVPPLLSTGSIVQLYDDESGCVLARVKNQQCVQVMWNSWQPCAVFERRCDQ